MSYDIEFVLIDVGTDPLTEARRSFSAEPQVSSTADDDKRKLLVADILSLHSTLRMEPHDLGFSHGCWIGGGDDETCPFPDIHVGVRSAFVPISYANNSEILRRLGPLHAIFSRHGYVAYDPQTDALWIPDEAIGRYGGTQNAIIELYEKRDPVVPSAQTTQPKPWWKLW